ncbi:acidic leucine-rich nuclear phosphoprotein 32 family member A isoform X1 [Cervus elaphus]|uniref:acidic leucine-rich nuclear phosphoprotein 32 family member A isoform X1 n=1 Tax=Cervus canadensis TaxID=1574408 RepID=UPI001C9E6890|nr:acidic leucine-rich nuclear phosphoprotein 32 family member A isoform X1 [Cervus canadensis]XP_043775731.1 acidic leucine-rich nuclear phosphoprotein 32 family member A isoform X1 [Cervus elaphus]
MFPGSRAARPAPPPWRGRRRARGSECGRRAPCGAGRGPAAGRRGGRASCARAGPRARGAGPRAGLLASRAGLELEVFYYYCIFNGQARRRPNPKGAEALLGARGGRQGPARLWQDCRAPGCHFVTVAVVAVGGWGRRLAPSPRRPRTWKQQGERAAGTRSRALGPYVGGGVPSPCQRREALLERRGGRCSGRATILPASAPPTPQRAPCLPRPPSLQYFVLPPAGVLEVVQCDPKDERIDPVFAFSAELIGG